MTLSPFINDWYCPPLVKKGRRNREEVFERQDTVMYPIPKAAEEGEASTVLGQRLFYSLDVPFGLYQNSMMDQAINQGEARLFPLIRRVPQ
jgi:hypothetical protein